MHLSSFLKRATGFFVQQKKTLFSQLKCWHYGFCVRAVWKLQRNEVSTNLPENKFPLFNHQPSASTHIVTLPVMHVAGEIGLLSKYREGQYQGDNPNNLTGSTRGRLEIQIQMTGRRGRNKNAWQNHTRQFGRGVFKNGLV